MVNERAESPCPQWAETANANPQMEYPESEIPHRTGRYRPEGSPFSSPIRWSCRCMKGFMIRGRDLISHRCPWQHEPQPISDLTMELGFPHRAGRYRLGGPPFSSPIRRRCGDTEIYPIREWDLILPWWRCLYEPQPVSDRSRGVGFPHRAERYRLGGPPFLSPVCWSYTMYGSISDPGMGPYPPRLYELQLGASTPCRAASTRGTTVSVPGLLSCGCMERFRIRGLDLILSGWRWLYESEPINNKPVGIGFPQHVGVFTPYGAVSTRETTVFVPGLMEL